MWRSSLLALLLAAASVPAADEVTIDSLAWLAGCWAYDGREPGSAEHWLEPAGGAMLAVARVIKDDRMVSYEFMRIEETSEGTLRLIAAPVGQAVTAFALAAIGQDFVIFENPEHDFPRWITYRLVEPGRLIGRAESETDGQRVGIDFPMTRTSCQPDD